MLNVLSCQKYVAVRARGTAAFPLSSFASAHSTRAPPSFRSRLPCGTERESLGGLDAKSFARRAASASATASPSYASRQAVRFDVLQVLRERGLLNDATNEQGLAGELKRSAPMTVYCGFDPTADSLHLGNLLGIIVLTWFARAGHKVIALCGGATGLVGDPSGKSAERPMLDVETLNYNTTCIGNQLTRLMTSSHDPSSSGEPFAVEVVNNLEWFESMTFLDFLRDVGKFARVGAMMSKDSVKSRMEATEGAEDKGTGISFTEFSYQLLQGYDFMHLYKSRKCRIQIGGSDQWGNITAGTDLIRRLCAPEVADKDVDEAGADVDEQDDTSLAYGVTFPLLVGSDGKKFGKSEGGAIWLEGSKLSPYHMYQHLLRTPDDDVVKFLKMLTFLDMSEISEIAEKMDPGHPDHPGPNAAQKILASEVTRFVHGEGGLEQALKITKGLFESQRTKDGPPSLEVSHSSPSPSLPSLPPLPLSLCQCADLCATTGCTLSFQLGTPPAGF